MYYLFFPSSCVSSMIFVIQTSDCTPKKEYDHYERKTNVALFWFLLANAASSLPLLVGTFLGAISNKLTCIFIWMCFSFPLKPYMHNATSCTPSRATMIGFLEYDKHMNTFSEDRTYHTFPWNIEVRNCSSKKEHSTVPQAIHRSSYHL